MVRTEEELKKVAREKIKADIKRWPKYVKLYEMAFDRMLERNRRDNPDYGRTWKTGKDVMKWWLGEQPKSDDSGGNISLYGLRLDETDT